MSLKGLGKSFARAPQTFKARFNIGENTKDPVYIDAERRFQELEKETKKLHDDSKKYFDAINGTHFPLILHYPYAKKDRNVEPSDRIFQSNDRIIQTHLGPGLGSEYVHH